VLISLVLVLPCVFLGLVFMRRSCLVLSSLILSFLVLSYIVLSSLVLMFVLLGCTITSKVFLYASVMPCVVLYLGVFIFWSLLRTFGLVRYLFGCFVVICRCIDVFWFPVGNYNNRAASIS
jgi:hypothetical protein